MKTLVSKSFITELWHFSIYQYVNNFRSLGYKTKQEANEALIKYLNKTVS